ncbi:hypothetical protein G9F71_008470 [Clostridium sp. FP2]|uniref:hypothetical protein n=1 Tax=Clostridium sp. FP2 TaxID=2724481 RepID=UPI0013E901F5|nr:hypothetical protein [Clostridium sp. FP2]MBZ9622886.1 hypothetical protein [Clostridium sp. FP2]
MNEIKCNEYGCIENEKFKLEISINGDVLVYKNIAAFQSKHGVCYAVAELNEPNEISKYTYNNFLEEAEGNEILARNCFEMTGEMNTYPDYYFEMGLEEGWFVQCKCMHVFDHHTNDKCPRCGSRELVVGDWDYLGEE